MAKIPNNAYVMIIGAMKSGTSTLYWHLSQHPNICSCIVKEPEFFSENQGHGVSVEQYSDLWNFDPDQHKYVLEASTGYTKYPKESNVANRIKAYGISPTFIYIIRNPFKRIESDYNWSMNKKWFNPKTPISDDRYVYYSNYFIQLEQYRNIFGSKSIMVLDFEELVINPKELITFIFNSLKLDCSELEVVDVIKYKTAHLSQAEVIVNMVPFLRSAKSLLPHTVKRLFKRLFKTYFGLSEKRQLSEDERVIIHKKSKPDMDLFNYHYGFDVKKWGF